MLFRRQASHSTRPRRSSFLLVKSASSSANARASENRTRRTQSQSELLGRTRVSVRRLQLAARVLSRGLLNLRRSISVPDLSQTTSLFHHVDAESETRILHTLDVPHVPAAGSQSYSSDELFIDNVSNNSPKHHLTTSNENVFNSCEPSHSNKKSPDSPSEPTNPPTTVRNDSLQVDSTDLSNSLDMSLKTGELSQQQRRKKLSENIRSSIKDISKPTSCLNPPECTVTVISDLPKSCNRDSGFEESVTVSHSIADPYLNQECSIPE